MRILIQLHLPKTYTGFSVWHEQMSILTSEFPCLAFEFQVYSLRESTFQLTVIH